jgi:hypothetical protein
MANKISPLILNITWFRLSLVKEIKNMKKLNVALAIFVAAVMAGNAQTTVTSEIVGYQNITVKGSQGGASFFSFVPIQLSKAPAFAGLGSANGAVVTLTGGVVGDVTAIPHYLIIKSGSGVGYVSDVVSSSSTTVTTAEDLSSYITSGTSVAVVPHVLIIDVFGAADTLVLGGGTADTADTIYLVGSDGSFKPYYYKNVGFGQGWKNASTGLTEATVPVYPNESILVERRAEGDTQVLTQVGSVAQDSKLVYTPGFNSGASAYPSIMTLSALQSVVQGGTADTADTVYLVDSASGQLSPFYYKNVGFGQGWKDASTGLTVDATTISINGGFVLERKVNSTAVLAQTKPY